MQQFPGEVSMLGPSSVSSMFALVNDGFEKQGILELLSKHSLLTVAPLLSYPNLSLLLSCYMA